MNKRLLLTSLLLIVAHKSYNTTFTNSFHNQTPFKIGVNLRTSRGEFYTTRHHPCKVTSTNGDTCKKWVNPGETYEVRDNDIGGITLHQAVFYPLNYNNTDRKVFTIQLGKTYNREPKHTPRSWRLTAVAYPETWNLDHTIEFNLEPFTNENPEKNIQFFATKGNNTITKQERDLIQEKKLELIKTKTLPEGA